MAESVLNGAVRAGKIEVARKVATFFLRNPRSLIRDVEGDIYIEDSLADISLTLWLCANYKECAALLMLPHEPKSYENAVVKSVKDRTLLEFLSLYFVDSSNVSERQYLALRGSIENSDDQVLSGFLERKAVVYIRSFAARRVADERVNLSLLALYCDLLRFKAMPGLYNLDVYFDAAKYFELRGDSRRQREALLKGLSTGNTDFAKPLLEVDKKNGNQLLFLQDLISLSLRDGSFNELGSRMHAAAAE